MICLDLETGGLSPTHTSILSIGAVDFDSDVEFYVECRNYPNRIVDPHALRVNGFTEAQANDTSKMFPNEAYKKLVEWVKENKLDPLLAGQNVGSFDVPFLRDAQSATTADWIFGYHYVDLFSIAYAKFGKRLKMDEILAACGLPAEQKPHNALTGAKTTKMLLKKLLQ